MAQIIDLGKIRFNWAGTYDASVTYSYNDIVKYGSNIYAYTNSVANLGQTPQTPSSYWTLVIQGITYRGTYTSGTLYYVNDIVIDGQNTYITLSQHTASSGTALGNANLQIIAQGQSGLPNQANKANYLLTTDATNTSWTNTLKLKSEFVGDQAGGSGSYGQLALNWAGTPGVTTVNTNVISAFAVTRNDNFAQFAIANLADGADVSSDFITYTNDGSDSDGFMDMGITSRTFDSANYGITGPHDGYIFMSAPRGTTYSIQTVAAAASVATLSIGTHPLVVGDKIYVEDLTGANRTIFNGMHTITARTSTTVSFATTSGSLGTTTVTETAFLFKQYGNGNLVLATDMTGLSNNIVFAAGGYNSGRTQMTIYPDVAVSIAITGDSTSATTGALRVAGGIGSSGKFYGSSDIKLEGIVYGGTGSRTFGATLTNPMAVYTLSSGTSASYDQFAVKGQDATNSTDLIVYADNGTDAHGWIDMGMTGSNFSQTQFGITGKNDGYIFVDAPTGTTGYGNLVLATGSQGTRNRIIFGAGGFSSGRTQMEIIPDTSVKINIATASTSAVTGALVVTGGVGITGDVNIAGNITFGGSGTQVSTANLAVVAPLVFTGSGSTSASNDLGLITEGKYTITNIPITTVVNKQLVSNVATLITSVAHNFAVGDSVTVASLDSTFNGTYTITAVPSTTSFQFAKTNIDVASTRIGDQTFTITNKALVSNTATLQTSTTHTYIVGNSVVVTGVDSTFNGTYTITAVTSNTFSYAKTYTNVTSTS